MATTISTSQVPGGVAVAQPLSTVARRIALLTLICAQFIIMLDTSIVNVALPSLANDLKLTETGTAWVVNAYFLTFGGLLLVAGRLSDVFGRRRMFLVGGAVFVAASVMAGLAPSELVLIVARLMQGIGAALLSPAAFSILLVLFTGPQKATAVSAWGAASAAGGATGVFAGGVITGSLGWEWVFFLPIPVALVALATAFVLFKALPATPARRRFDIGGPAAITATALALVYTILAAADHGWNSPQTLVPAVLAVILLLATVWIERAALDPTIPRSVISAPGVKAGIFIGLLGGAARVCTFFLVALYLQQALLYDPQHAGAAMVPTSIAVFTVSVLILPRFIRLLGAEKTVAIGLVILATGLFWLSRSPMDGSYASDVLPGLMLAAAGVALSFMPSTMIITSAVSSHQSGLASGMASASSQIGGAIGIALFSAVLAVRSRSATGSGLSAEEALAHGFSGAFAAAATMALAAAALTALLLLRSRSSGGKRRGPDAMAEVPAKVRHATTQNTLHLR